MDILLISNEDMCRSRMAQELLNSFGRGFKFTTAGIAEGNAVPDVVWQFMSAKGYEISRKKPVHVSACMDRQWDFVVTLTKEAEDELSMLPIRAEQIANFHFEDALTTSDADLEIETLLSALYEDMYKQLYEFYRDVLSELVAPRCTCGANTYCRCE